MDYHFCRKETCVIFIQKKKNTNRQWCNFVNFGRNHSRILTISFHGKITKYITKNCTLRRRVGHFRNQPKPNSWYEGGYKDKQFGHYHIYKSWSNVFVYGFYRNFRSRRNELWYLTFQEWLFIESTAGCRKYTFTQPNKRTNDISEANFPMDKCKNINVLAEYMDSNSTWLRTNGLRPENRSKHLICSVKTTHQTDFEFP